MEVVIVALFGLAAGQAVDLLWGRFYTGEEIRGALYRCAGCREPIQRPLLVLPFAAAILWEEGRCPRCGEQLSARSIVLPGSATILFLFSYLAFDGAFWPAVLGGVFALMFFTLALTDLETRLLPNRVVYPGMALAVAFAWVWPDTSMLQIVGGGVTAVLIAALMLLVAAFMGGEAIGMGDIKMIVLMGLVTGVPAFLVGIFIGVLAGGIGAAFLLLTGRAGRRDYMPHGPFLALGAIIALFWGQDIWEAYTG
jgi:leader peptidase (prepilin peptidase)/N-methyltransferase